MPPRNTNSAHYFETETPVTEQEITRALTKAGIRATQYRSPLPKIAGVIFTPFTIADIWDLATGKSRCDGSCSGRETRHLPWTELSQEQRQEFTADVVRFMKNNTFSGYNAHRSLAESYHLQNVELGPCNAREAAGS